MQFLGCEQRESISQIESGLSAVDGEGPCPCSIAPRFPVFQHQSKQIMILTHRVQIKRLNRECRNPKFETNSNDPISNVQNPIAILKTRSLSRISDFEIRN